MSMPFSIITCDQCDTSWGTNRVWGIFRYQLPEGQQAWVERKLAWCHSCSAFCPVEVIPPKNKLLADLKEAKEGLDAAQAELVKDNWIRRTLKRPSRLRREMIELGMKKYREAQASLDCLAIRKSPPRCLECGSTHITDIIWKKEFPANINGEEFFHPSCGGKLSEHDSGYMVSARSIPRLYDVEGNVLHAQQQKA